MAVRILGQDCNSVIAGVDDDFAMPADPASPDADLLAILPEPVYGFDEDGLPGGPFGGGGSFGHTFDNLPQNIVGASLTFRLRVGVGSFNDVLYLEPLDGPGSWTSTVSTLPGGVDGTFTFDLAALPVLGGGGGTTSIIDRINADGSLDFYITDDTAVDYLALSFTTEKPACPTDLDIDGSTGFSDLTSLLSKWGPCAAPCPYDCPDDLDENGTVGFTDLTTLLSSWGACN